MASEVSVTAIAPGTAMPPKLHAKALGLLRDWLVVGGMPAAVESFRARRSHAEAGPVDVATADGRRAAYRLLSVPLYLTEQRPRLLDELS